MSIDDAKTQNSTIKDTWLERHYLVSATTVATITTIVNLKIIYWMNTPGGLDHGLGLASIGIITFFGTTLASSIFEEHRHDHGNKKSQSLTTIIAGKGIMRKSLAASLVMTYIVLIGLSFSAGTLHDSIKNDAEFNGILNNSTSIIEHTTPDESSKGDVVTNVDIDLENIGQFLGKNNQIDELVLKTDPITNKVQEIILTKEPDTLVEHFTIVISVVIGFYFGANAVSSILKSRKTPPTAEDILKIMYITDEIKEDEYKKKLAALKE